MRFCGPTDGPLYSHRHGWIVAAGPEKFELPSLVFIARSAVETVILVVVSYGNSITALAGLSIAKSPRSATEGKEARSTHAKSR